MSGENDAIDENFFATIDTPLKSYILGVIAFNNLTMTTADAGATADAADAADAALNVCITLNNEKDHDNNNRSVSYGYYCDLSDNDKKNYPYFNNIDRLIGYLRKIGSVKYHTGTLELTISSLSSQKIKEEIASHTLKSIDDNCGDLTDYITKCYVEDIKKCNQFVKAYIEKYGCIINDHLNITFYNDKMADCISKLYDIPHNILKGINNLVIQYKGVNMIDLLGMLYSDYDCPYYNNYIYTFNSRDGSGGSGGGSVPTIKVFKVDERAVVPSKSRYSDTGYDLTIISEYKRLTSNTVIYDTGIQLEIPNGYYVEIVPRSSISRSGYMLANNVGIIDQGYRGNLYIALTKINDETPDLTDLTEWRLPWKCCQMIVKKHIYSRLVITDVVAERAKRAECAENDEFLIEKSSRGTGAFGSTGGAWWLRRGAFGSTSGTTALVQPSLA
jgi:deoxyuridine 5'-triphosphate nucleotidohydrolase